MNIDKKIVGQLKRLSKRSQLDVWGNATGRYMKIAPQQLGLMQHALENKDFQVIRKNAYLLKSSSGTLGLGDIVHLCESIEENANNEMLNNLTTEINQLQLLLPEAMTLLNKV